MDRPVRLTIPKDKNRFQVSKPQRNTSKDVRVRPISAKPEKSYRSLVSQSRVKHFCAFCEEKVGESDSYENTIKSLIDTMNFYQEYADSEDVKLSEEINHIQLPLKIKALRIGKQKR